jgi:hypothetical protein
MIDCDKNCSPDWWLCTEVKPTLSNNTNYRVGISVLEFENCKSELADMRYVTVKYLYQNVLVTEQFLHCILAVTVS